MDNAKTSHVSLTDAEIEERYSKLGRVIFDLKNTLGSEWQIEELVSNEIKANPLLRKWLIQNKDSEILHPIIRDILFEAYPELSRENTNEPTLLIQACADGDIDSVVELLTHDGIDLGMIDEFGRNALMIASESGRNSLVSLLLRHGLPFDVNAVDEDGNSALMLACINGYDEVVVSLLNLPSININILDKDGNTALMLASSYGYSKVVRLLLKTWDGDINIVNSNGISALMLACAGGHEKVVAQLLETDAIQINDANQDGSTALMFASGYGHDKVVKQLLETDGIDINASVNSESVEYTALGLARDSGHQKIIEMLEAQDALELPSREN